MMMRTRFFFLGAAAQTLFQGYSEDEAVMRRACAAFAPEYVRWGQDGYEIRYPASLSQGEPVSLSGTYTQQVLDCLNDWAVPTA